MRTHIYKRFIRTRSTDRDLMRQEFILNVLLFGLLCISLAALATVCAVSVLHANRLGAQSFMILGVFIALLLFSRRLIRRGRVRLAAYLLLGLLSAVTTGLLVYWGFALPQMLLDYTMVIIMAGILINARTGLIISGCAAVTLLGVAFLQINHIYTPDTSWSGRPPLFSDAIGFALVFSVIGLVSWLSNREIDRSLERARRSEAALLQEKDNLEVKVIERTQELERLQLTRILELERFASFGRINATLVHDMANPLMAASFGLQQLTDADRSQLKLVNDNLRQIEKHLHAARQQLRGQSERSLFNVDQELRRVIRTVQLRANLKKVRLLGPSRTGLKLYGDPLKFGQILANLITNAVESYEYVQKVDASVVLSVQAYGQGGVRIIVQDHGSGISPTDRAHIFEPFFSRRRDNQGAGIGLSIVKQFVDIEFNGRITVRSMPEKGSRFTVTLYSAEHA